MTDLGAQSELWKHLLSANCFHHHPAIHGITC